MTSNLFKAFQTFLRVVHVSHYLTIHLPSRLWMLAKVPFLLKVLLLKLPIWGALEVQSCSWAPVWSCDHDASHMWERWEILLTFSWHHWHCLFANDLQSSERDRHRRTEKRDLSSFTHVFSFPCPPSSPQAFNSPGLETYPSDRQDSLLSITHILLQWDRDTLSTLYA